MPVHYWEGISDGTFHHFHNNWIAHLSARLNQGLLPANVHALIERSTGPKSAELLTPKADDAELFETTVPELAPQTYMQAFAGLPSHLQKQIENNRN